MTVAKLIELLSQYKADAEIRVYEGHPGLTFDASGIVIMYDGEDQALIKTEDSY